MANRIALELIADANPLLKGMEQAQRSIMKFVDASNDAGQALGSGVNKAIDSFMNFSKGGATAAGLLAGGLAAATSAAVALTASAGREIEALDMLSQKTGIALNTLQQWSVVMAENDFQAESLTSSMRTLSKQITEARDPSTKAAAAFEEIGISIDGLSSTESVIRALSDRFKDMPDGPEKARIAIEFLGKAGLEMIPIMNRGSKAFDESKEAAERFAAVLRSNQVNALKAADDAMDRVGVAANALKSQLGAVFAPTVEMAAKALSEVLGTLARWARDLDTALDTLAIRLTHIGLAAKELAKVLFSTDALNGDAWRQALTNISLIDKEAAKLIAKRRELAELGDAIKIEEVTVKPNPNDAIQEALGRKIVAQALYRYRLLLAEQRAQEALGKTVNDIAMREFGERNKAFGLMVQEEERVRVLNLELSKPPNTGPFVEAIERKEEAVRNLLNIMPELNREEAIALYMQNQATAEKVINTSTEAWLKRNDAIEMAVDRARVLDESQQAMFATERGSFGAADDARLKRMQLIEAEGELQRRVIDQTIFDEQRKNAAIENLEIQLDTKRRQAIQQFPTFFEQQMQAVVQSNSFSIGQITTTWTSGLANAAVNGGNFVEQAWKSTQVAVLQGLLNFGIQKAAQLALQASVEAGIVSASAAAQMGLNTAKNATIVAGDAAAATATTTIWASAGAAITGTFASITGAISLFFTGSLLPMFVSLGEVLMTFLSALATSLDISIFGAPFSIPVWAAVALVGAAIGTIAAFAFADGGIVTGPTMGMVGEAGSNEAVIPLNKRGASFMRDAMGGRNGRSGNTTVVVELDGRQLGRAVFDSMDSVMHVRGVSV